MGKGLPAETVQAQSRAASIFLFFFFFFLPSSTQYYLILYCVLVPLFIFTVCLAHYSASPRKASSPLIMLGPRAVPPHSEHSINNHSTNTRLD